MFYFYRQANAGAVMLTDCVFWFIIFPFLTEKDYSLNFVSAHTHARAPCLLFLFSSLPRGWPTWRLAVPTDQMLINDNTAHRLISLPLLAAVDRDAFGERGLPAGRGRPE